MKLPLALDIADRVVEAQITHTAVDIPAEADNLVTSHPEAEASIAEVAEALAEELRATASEDTMQNLLPGSN